MCYNQPNDRTTERIICFWILAQGTREVGVYDDGNASTRVGSKNSELRAGTVVYSIVWQLFRWIDSNPYLQTANKSVAWSSKYTRTHIHIMIRHMVMVRQTNALTQTPIRLIKFFDPSINQISANMCICMKNDQNIDRDWWLARVINFIRTQNYGIYGHWINAF